MLILGLTGTIASGKSTVSSHLAAPPHNIPVIDADRIARQVVEPGTPGYNAIVEYFKDKVDGDLFLPHPDDRPRPLNRAVLGRAVFGDGEDKLQNRRALNRITHPAIRREMVRQLLAHYLRGSWCVVLDVPLLFESGWVYELISGCVFFVKLGDDDVQLQRLLARDKGLSAEDALKRIEAQMPTAVKELKTRSRPLGRGVVLDNGGSEAALKAQVDKEIQKLKEENPAWWSKLLLFFPPLALARAAWIVFTNWRSLAAKL